LFCIRRYSQILFTNQKDTNDSVHLILAGHFEHRPTFSHRKKGTMEKCKFSYRITDLKEGVATSASVWVNATSASQRLSFQTHQLSSFQGQYAEVRVKWDCW
jgi:hypothetical protein